MVSPEARADKRITPRPALRIKTTNIQNFGSSGSSTSPAVGCCDTGSTAVLFATNTIRSSARNREPSPPVQIRKLNEPITPGSSYLATPLSSAARGKRRVDLHQFAKQKLTNSPVPLHSPKVTRQRNTVCIKVGCPSPRRAGMQQQEPAPIVILDELRACQNCSSKFYANNGNTEASGYFCSGECMWSVILKENTV